MSSAKPVGGGLDAGTALSRAEFLRRGEAMPNIKLAELIRGTVRRPPPVSIEQGVRRALLNWWLGLYSLATPGCQALSNATWLMLAEEAPQPVVSLHIRRDWGGQFRKEGLYAAGAPEFLAEVCDPSAEPDLREKLEVYQEAEVQESLVVAPEERVVRWHRLVSGQYVVVPPPADGIHRSAVFPGLWLDGAALLAHNSAGVRAVLRQGLASQEHVDFVARLEARQPS